MKNTSDFSPKAIKRSKKKQYLIGIAGTLTLCIVMFCVASIFPKSFILPEQN